MRIIADSSQMQAGNQALYVLPELAVQDVQELAKDHASIAINSLHNIGPGAARLAARLGRATS